MKAQSDAYPPAQIKSRGKTHIPYNVREITIEDPDSKPRTAYEYEYVIIEDNVTREKIISAILNADHDINDQIAILFNERAGKDVAEYDAYQTKRIEVKKIVDAMTL